MNPELSLTVSIYNEVNNIATLAHRVHEALAPHCRYELIVVDDDSPDGTAEAARGLDSEYLIITPIQDIIRSVLSG